MQTDNSKSVVVSNISKRYTINPLGQPGVTTFRDWLTSFGPKNTIPVRYHQALSEVSFSLAPGDRLGIIGPNGAGKTTLLKVLAKITQADQGEFKLRGKATALLEVGTAFHPELTGRENIFLNGAILGMSRSDIIKEFDNIVIFSEIGSYLDVPLKRYSTGMQMRLGFAIAAYMYADVLLIDEVLAVGDRAFQERCFRKMQDLSGKGRTILFVSHNFTLIEKFCNKGLVLIKGKTRYFGSPLGAINVYTKETTIANNQIWTNSSATDKHEPMYINTLKLTDKNQQLKSEFTNIEPIYLHFDLRINKPVDKVKVGFDLWKNGQLVFRSQQVDSLATSAFKPGKIDISCLIPPKLLNAGDYLISPLLSIHCLRSLTSQTNTVLGFSIVIDPSPSPFHTVLNTDNHPGLVFPLLTWQVAK